MHYARQKSAFLIVILDHLSFWGFTMFNTENNLAGIMNIEDAYVVTREDLNAPISSREYRTSQRTWSNKIEEAKVYEDMELASNIRRFVAKNPGNFLQKNGFAIPTRFASTKLGDIVDQLFKGDQDAITLTQGLGVQVRQHRRDYRPQTRIINPD
jgi:hypothetical protein